MPPNPPRNVQRRDMSSTCAGRPLLVLHNFPVFSLLLSIMPDADDTTLYCNINQDIYEEVINSELLKLWEWLGANKLSLNIAKTKYMVFHTSKRNVIYPNLKVNNSNIERVTQFNFLGVILHSHMTWNKYINHISMKIVRSRLSASCIASEMFTQNLTSILLYTIL